MIGRDGHGLAISGFMVTIGCVCPYDVGSFRKYVFFNHSHKVVILVILSCYACSVGKCGGINALCIELIYKSSGLYCGSPFVRYCATYKNAVFRFAGKTECNRWDVRR